MDTASIEVVRRPERLVSDDKRVITRYFDFGRRKRIRSILRRVMRIADSDVPALLNEVMGSFSARHRDLEGALMENFRRVALHMRSTADLSRERRLLIGAYFTLEYSIESAALFNPSIVKHPDQTDVPDGAVRFLLSLRGTGEGHISSIVFRRGLIEADGTIRLDAPPRLASRSRPIANKMFEKEWFICKLEELGMHDPQAKLVLEKLPGWFDYEMLQEAVRNVRRMLNRKDLFRKVSQSMLWLAKANYEVRFPEGCRPSEVVIFPATESESHGMEDLRLTRFTEPNGDATYYGTYTAFGASGTLPMLLRTTDFRTFYVSTLAGKYVKNKGMALFPRQVGGRFLMASRHDGENMYLLESDNIFSWNHVRKLQTPLEPWEAVQIGNCGSPIETEAGWILLTHGVGPIRRYCIGALLLDKDDPARILGRLKQPLITPTDEEREGYVPNVVYSCGSMIHDDLLVIPYAMSDQASGFATVRVSELLDLLISSGP